MLVDPRALPAVGGWWLGAGHRNRAGALRCGVAEQL